MSDAIPRNIVYIEISDRVFNVAGLDGRSSLALLAARPPEGDSHFTVVEQVRGTSTGRRDHSQREFRGLDRRSALGASLARPPKWGASLA